MLEVEDLAEKDSGGSGEGAAGLNDEAEAPRGGLPREQADVVRRCGRDLVDVVDAEPASHVEVPQGDALFLQAVNDLEDLVGCVREGLQVKELRADVAVDADGLEVGIGCGLLIEGLGALYWDAELVLLEARRDVRMGLRVNVRVHPYGERCPEAKAPRGAGESLELGLGLYVEAEDAGLQRELHLGDGLAYSGVDDLVGIRAGAERPLQLAAGDDVEPGAKRCHK